MSHARCATHPAAAAEYRCDGCERLLCEECIEEGHRLLFCRQCGERALPLEESGARDTTELARQRAERAPYGVRDALGYPFRGLGGYVFWGTLAVLGTFRVIEAAVLLGALALLIPRLLIAVLMPGLLFSIVRSSARGESELPDWPDWFDGERLREFFSAVALGLFTILPAVVLAWLLGCDAEALLGAALGCWAAIFLGLGLGFLVWIPAFAAVAAFGPGLLSLRIDLHLRALAATLPATVRVAGLTLGLAVAGEIVALALAAIPLVGGLAGLGIDLYALFVGTHLIGLLLRTHERDLEPIYCQ